MTAVVILADSIRSPELRHEVPIGIPDPFLYVEKDGARHIQIGSMEIPRLAELGRFELHPNEEFGFDDLVSQGLDLRRIRTAEIGPDRAGRERSEREEGKRPPGPSGRCGVA